MKFHALKVLEKRFETPDAYTIKLEKPPGDTFDYLPGQYLTLRTEVHGEDTRRAFSLSSCPTEDDFLAVTIKTIPDGKMTPYLKNVLEAGDRLEVFPPMGKFTLRADPKARRHHIMMAGGSGITPIMSMIRTLLREERKSRITLLYGNRTYQDIIFREEFDALQKKHPKQLKVVHVLSRETWDGEEGRLAGELAERLIAEAEAENKLNKVYYLCGPSPMMDSLTEILFDKKQLPKEAVKREYYTAPVPKAAKDAAAEGEGEEVQQEYELTTQTVTVILEGQTHRISVRPEQSILDAVIDAGYDPPYACQEGVCTTCRARLYEGVVSMDEREGLADEEIEAGYILTCQAHPLTDQVELEYG